MVLFLKLITSQIKITIESFLKKLIALLNKNNFKTKYIEKDDLILFNDEKNRYRLVIYFFHHTKNQVFDTLSKINKKENYHNKFNLTDNPNKVLKWIIDIKKNI